TVCATATSGRSPSTSSEPSRPRAASVSAPSVCWRWRNPDMHLLIDGQALQTSSSRLRGIGRYSSNLLRALAVARPDWRIEVVQNRPLPPVPDDDLAGLPVLTFPPPLPAANEHRETNERYYADWLTARGSDGVLVLSHCEGWEAVVPWFCGP